MSYPGIVYVGARRSKAPPITLMAPKALLAASLKPFVLSLLAEGDSYGYEIVQRVHLLTAGEVQYTTGTLYPVLHDLEASGLLESYWREGENAPRRKYYRLTPRGQQALQTERQHWLRVHAALAELWGGLGGPVPSGLALNPS